MKRSTLVLLCFGVMLALPWMAQAAPSVKGTTGLFELVSGETLPKGKFNVALYADKFDRRVLTARRGAPTPPFLERSLAIDTYEYSLSGGYGILDWLEVGLQVPFVMAYSDKTWGGTSVAPFFWNDLIEDKYSESGMGDPWVSVKFRFLNLEKQRLFMAAVLEGKVPAADDQTGLGTGQFDVGARVAFTKEWNRVGLHFNVGYYYLGDPETPTSERRPGVEDTVDLDNKIYGGIGLDFCPFRVRNFKLILEFEGYNNTYDFQELNKYQSNVINGVLGFRYFFTPKKVSDAEALKRYTFSIGAGVRYAIGEKDPPTINGVKDGGSTNPWGFVAHVAFGPRMYTDMCIIKPRAAKERLTVVAYAEPPVHEVKESLLTENKEILDKNGNLSFVTSRIRATATSRMFKSDQLSYAWKMHYGDINAAVDVTDFNGNPITTAEFDFNFDKAEDVFFVVTVTNPNKDTASAETKVAFKILKDSLPIISIPIVYFDFDKYDIRATHQAELEGIAKLLTEEYKEVTLLLEGHTCPMGTTEYNLALGERRAHSVLTFLSALGVQATRLDWVSYGEDETHLALKVQCRRADCQDKKEELSINRRTEVKVTGGVPEGVKVDPANLPGAIGGNPPPGYTEETEQAQ